RPRFLSSLLAGENTPTLCDPIRCSDRARCGFDDPGGDQLYVYWSGSAGNVSEAAFVGGGASIDSISLHVWCAAQDRCSQDLRQGALPKEHASCRGHERLPNDSARNCRRVFPGTKDQLAAMVRN